VGQVGRDQRQKAESSCVGPLCCLPSYLSPSRLGYATDLGDGTSCRCGCCQRPHHAYGSSSNFQSLERGGWLQRALATRKSSGLLIHHQGWISSATSRRLTQRTVAAALVLLRCVDAGGGAVALTPCSTVALLASAPASMGSSHPGTSPILVWRHT
jgi:hypothetical protein